MKVTIDVDADIYRGIKVEAARTDRSVRDVVDEALAAWLEASTTPSAERILPLAAGTIVRRSPAARIPTACPKRSPTPSRAFSPHWRR